MAKRRESKKIWVGKVAIGGDAPISVQSMTNTQTEDVEATVKQIKELENAGADLVRVSVPNDESATSFAKIKKQVQIPLIADIHFDYKLALKVAPFADCLRINPGNIGDKTRVYEVVQAAKDNGIAIRIGVNAGSLEKPILEKYREPSAKAMVESALKNIDYLNHFDFDNFKLSLKASNVDMSVQAYKMIANQIIQPLHLGITESGTSTLGSIKSAIGLGILLYEGIGDTIRVSLAAPPVEEIKVGFNILKSLGLRSRGVNLIACPSCSRQNFDVIKVAQELEKELEGIKEDLDVAIIGCVVNGPGESKQADIGLVGGKPNLMYSKGKPCGKVDNAQIVNHIKNLVNQEVSLKNIS